jgi:hypothetical protein
MLGPDAGFPLFPLDLYGKVRDSEAVRLESDQSDAQCHEGVEDPVEDRREKHRHTPTKD